MSSWKDDAFKKRGYPLPQGVTLLQEGINFSIFSRHATGATLVIQPLTRDGRQTRSYDLCLDPEEHRTGDMFHVLLATHDTNLAYGWRLHGANAPEQGLAYDRNNILIDPYCRSLLPRNWGDPARYGEIPCCLLSRDEFDWQNDRHPRTPLSETVIYELHVRGFTNHPSSQVDSPGTFAGLVAKIPYLQDLGVTAVELMPVNEFDENDVPFLDPVTGGRLRNFWGYSPVSFFALNSGYASDPAKAVREFKTMVRALHQAGIEVYLDMVYNHTGEGGYLGTTSSFRGIDNQIYYLLDDHGNYRNFSGCGNTMNCNHPVVRELIRSSLRYWVTEMHVDGFRFDLASILGRDRHGQVLANPPMIELIGEDPVLRDTKMIAEAWDAAGLYQVGSFASDARWAEWNGRFRDDVRTFMQGQSGSVPRLATRIAGSSDLYGPSQRGPLCSINFVTSHDGFTLYDLVSYEHKHNQANGENNRDGDPHNISWNSGHEGDPAPASVNLLRQRRSRTFMVLLLLSQGVPMLLAGDEFGRSQGGNNNAWCQDNETSWLDWSLLSRNRDLHRFIKGCITLRRNFPHFRRDHFFPPDDQESNSPYQIRWQGARPDEQDWNDQARALGFRICGPTDTAGMAGDFLVLINGYRDRKFAFTLPPPPGLTAWQRIIDSGAAPPDDYVPIELAPRLDAVTEILVDPQACVVLFARAMVAGDARTKR